MIAGRMEEAPKPRLLDRVRFALRARHYSIRTEEAYVGWIRRFILFHGKRHPLEMGEEEVNAFLTNLAVEQNVSGSTQTQALSALVLLFDLVLHRPLGRLDLIRAAKPRRLPVVLSREEVCCLIDKLDGVARIVVTLLYGSGMRLLECLRLRVKDIDLTRNVITIREGKGD